MGITNIHQSKVEIQGKKSPRKNEKKKYCEREREREPFLYGKNMHRMGESGKFIVRWWEQKESK